MFSHIKLATFTWIITVLMVVTTAVIFISASFVEKNVVLINDTWSHYQSDLSEKARLEGSLRGAIGYDGMIHDFKNYVLRSDDKYFEHAQSHLGAAREILERYKLLELTAAEIAAIEDIKKVFDDYLAALNKTKMMISQGYSIIDIDKAVTVNDEPAIRGFKVLRYEVVSKQKQDKLSKTRILTDIRASLGYNGMIHKFKNYVLRHESYHKDALSDKGFVSEIDKYINRAKNSIGLYRELELNESEKLALNDIEQTLNQYKNNLQKIHPLMKKNVSVKDVDKIVRVDDTFAVRGLQILEHEINRQLTASSSGVTNAFNVVAQAILIGKWTSVVTVLLVMIILIVLIRSFIIQPIIELTASMIRLSDNKLDSQITGTRGNNEIGKMTRTVHIFKDNMIKQRDSEQALEHSNKDLQNRIEENKKLRERSEEQTTKALYMSERMIKAHADAEKAMTQAKKDEVFVSSVLSAVRDGIVTITSKGIIEIFNPGAEDIFGYKEHEVMGKNISMLMPEPHQSAHDGYLEKFKLGQSTRDQGLPLEQLALRKNGQTFPVEVTLNTIQIDDEIKVTGVVRDVTERKEWEKKIKEMALTDPLTRLANRNKFETRLNESLIHAQRFKSLFALLMIDLDKFKPVNDSFGHPVGDTLLQQVAEILVSSCREVDTVARLGGDEFAIILSGINEPEDAAIVARKLIDKLSQPFEIDNNKIQIGASVGISCYPNDTVDINELIRMADEALYLSKKEGRNTYRFYNK